MGRRVRRGATMQKINKILDEADAWLDRFFKHGFWSLLAILALIIFLFAVTKTPGERYEHKINSDQSRLHFFYGQKTATIA
jgi:hypothetical protein